MRMKANHLGLDHDFKLVEECFSIEVRCGRECELYCIDA